MKKNRHSFSLYPLWLKKNVLTLTLAGIFMSLGIAETFASTALQQQKVSLKLKNATVEQALKQITAETGLDFFYNDDEIDVSRRVSVDMSGTTVDEALKELFKGYDLSYVVSNNIVTIKSVKELPQKSVPQGPVTVTGFVRGDDGTPLIGALVMAKGTTAGVPTDINGSFSLTIPNAGPSTVLVFSYMGTSPKEVAIGSRRDFEIVLEPDSQQIEEIVVTGLVSMDKRIFTGASDRLVAEDIKIAGIPEISRALEGRSAGVSVQNISGTFGAAPKIRVRGATSIYGNSKPLWVVDGVVMEDVAEINMDNLASGDAETLISSAISGLNSDDIESFQILKDGSATSIYGARAMAGVIVITTKKGKAGVSRINYTGEFTMRMKPRYSEFNIMDSKEQMGVYKEMHEKGWFDLAGSARAKTSGVYGKMYNMMTQYDPVTGEYGMINDQNMINAYLRDAEMRNTDWFSLLFRNTVMHTHSLSISAGTDKVSTYASLSLMEDPGWTIQSRVRRMTANANTSFKILPNLTANIISNGSYRTQRAPGTQSQTTNSIEGTVTRDFDINPYSYALNTSRALDPNEYYTRNFAPFNIEHELENNYIELNVVDMKFQGDLRWKPYKNLEFTVLGALKYQTTSQEHKIKDYSNQAMAYRAMDDDYIRDNNSLLYRDPDDAYSLPISVLPEGGIYKRTDYKMLSYDFRASVAWNNVYNDKHIVNLYGGMETNSINRDRSNFYGWGLQYSMGEIPFYVYQYFKQGLELRDNYYGLNTTRSRNAAFFATGTYSYEGRYTVNGTIRYEGSNHLGRSRSARWLPTWNISGMWNVREEKFFHVLEPALSDLSFRVSYSLTADKGPTSVSNSLPVIMSGTRYGATADDIETMLYLYNIENSELTYEKKHELNIGVDVSFINRRISLSADWYKRNNYDLIGPIMTQGVGGQISKMANVASMKSSGIEFSLSTRNIVAKNFSWSTDLIFGYSKNEITELKSTPSVLSLVVGTGYAREGYPVRALFSIPFAGLTDKGYPSFIKNTAGEVTSGNMNLGSGDTAYLKYEGPTDPTTTGSFGNIFRWKNLTLNAYITYSFGNKVRLNDSFSSMYSDLTATPREFSNRWTLPGDEKTTNIPVILSAREYHDNSDVRYAYTNYNYSDVRVADGGFVRFKELSLAYDFPQDMIKGLKMHSLGLKFQVTNLCLIYSDKKLNGQDPEFVRAGGVSTPVPRQFTFTLRIGF